MIPSVCRSLTVLVVWLLVFGPASLHAQVRLAKVFGDQMVLQRDQAIPVWGWADPDEEIVVTLGDQTRKTRAEFDGEWGVKFDKLSATAEPLTLTARGAKNTITAKEILVGEVWLCSGQSNMAMTVNRARDYEAERRTANYRRLRMFTVRSGPEREPQDDCEGTWEVCSAETIGGFSATGYFFGRELLEKLDVPIGLINSSVGGTAIEAWTSIDVQKDNAELASLLEEWDTRVKTYDPDMAAQRHEKIMAAWKEAVSKARSEGRSPPRRPFDPIDPRLDRNHPANLFNGKIAPLIPFAIRGAIWYQGEHNARSVETATLYRVQLPLLIDDWRERWDQGDFPFAWAQLPNFKKPTDDPGAESEWAVMRESMLSTLNLPNTGMAVTIDIGEANDIHPKNKQDVGRRLAAWALSSVYGQKEVVGSGPMYASHKIKGERITIRFKNADGLTARGGEGTPKGFAIAGADKKWQWASAAIDGDTVIISHPTIAKPVAIRYGWADNPDCNLYNAAGLPASPFRTDDW